MKKSFVSMSIRGTLGRAMENKVFYYSYVVGFIAFIVYICSMSLDLGSWLSMCYNNTVTASEDKSLVEVSYINEEGTIFLVDGNSINRGDYEYIQTIVDSGVWYSMNQEAVCIPVTVNEIFSWVMRFIVLIPIEMILVFILSKFDKDLWYDSLFSVVLIRFLDLSYIVSCLAFPRGIMQALSGLGKWVWVIGVIGFVLGIMLILLTEKLLNHVYDGSN